MVEVDENVGQDHQREDEGGRLASLETFSNLFLHTMSPSSND